MSVTYDVIETLDSAGVLSRQIGMMAASIARRAARPGGWLKMTVWGEDDIFQELIMAVLSARDEGQFDAKRGEEAGYYYGVMRNRLRDMGRQQRKVSLSELMLYEIFGEVELRAGVCELDYNYVRQDAPLALEEGWDGGSVWEFRDPNDVIAQAESILAAYEFTCTLDKCERDVLAFLMCGYTQEEIGHWLVLRQQKVSKIKTKIGKKLLAYAREHDYQTWVHYREERDEFGAKVCGDREGGDLTSKKGVGGASARDRTFVSA